MCLLVKTFEAGLFLLKFLRLDIGVGYALDRKDGSRLHGGEILISGYPRFPEISVDHRHAIASTDDRSLVLAL